MEFKQNDLPIYIQIAKNLEDEIFIGVYKEGGTNTFNNRDLCWL